MTSPRRELFKHRKDHHMKTNVAETSVRAYYDHVIPHVEQPQQRLILDAMRTQPGRDWTIGELAKLTGLDKSSISGRRFDMLRLGILERGDERRCQVSGKRCETVKIPQGQQRLFA